MSDRYPRSFAIRFAGGLMMGAGALLYVGALSGFPVGPLRDLSGLCLLGGAVIYSVGEVIRTWD